MATSNSNNKQIDDYEVAELISYPINIKYNKC